MYYAALEAGGTKMVCAIGDENKNIIDKVTIPTDTADVSVPKMIEYFRRYPVASLGIGTFGPVCVDRKSSDYGKILKSPKKSWEGFNFYQTFSDALRCPVVVDTDVNAAALGEYLYGNLQGLSSSLYITVGTGIGGGFLMDGKPLHGMVHPEMGHVLLQRRQDDRVPSVCRCHENCLEGLASGPMLTQRTGMKGRSIPADSKVWDLEAYYLAQAIVDYTMVLSVERVVLGGGVMENEFLFPMIRKYYAELLNGYIESPRVCDLENYIVPAGLQGEQGIIGAMNLI